LATNATRYDIAVFAGVRALIPCNSAIAFLLMTQMRLLWPISLKYDCLAEVIKLAVNAYPHHSLFTRVNCLLNSGFRHIFAIYSNPNLI